MENQPVPLRVPTPPSQPSPSETPSVPKKSISNFFIIIPIILFLVIIGTAGYFAYQNYQLKKQETFRLKDKPVPMLVTPSPTPTPESTAGWETYENPYYKYSINIPSDWEIFEQTEDNRVVSIRPIGTEEIPISVTVVENHKGLSLDQRVNGKYGLDHPREQKAINNKEVVIVESNISPYPSITYHMAKFSNLYEISCSTLKEEYLTMCVQIVSTLKFTDKSEGIESVACGGWDTSGEVICKCSGKLTKPSCPSDALCDGGTYYCEGQCVDCCYKGNAENHPLPKCNR